MDEQVLNNTANANVDVSGYTPGIYIYQVIAGGETQTGKVLIQK